MGEPGSLQLARETAVLEVAVPGSFRVEDGPGPRRGIKVKARAREGSW